MRQFFHLLSQFHRIKGNMHDIYELLYCLKAVHEFHFADITNRYRTGRAGSFFTIYIWLSLCAHPFYVPLSVLPNAK